MNELHLLGGLVELVASGQGGAAWIEGEPGIGKSELITEGLTGAAARGCRVYRTAADEQSLVFPLNGLLEALGIDGPEPASLDLGLEPIRASRIEIVNLLGGDRVGMVTPVDTVDAAAERLVSFVQRLCAISPAVLVVDDVQWVDQASLWVLLRLSKLLRQLPLLLVIAARPVPARTEIDALRTALSDAGAMNLELGPLNAADAAALVQQLLKAPPSPRLAEQLMAAGGNALYLRELIDALLRESRLRLTPDAVDMTEAFSDLPTTLPAAIGRRLGFLSQRALSVLRTAAVLGPTFSVADVSTVTVQRATELIDVVSEATSAGVIAEADPPATMSFRHALVHQTLYEGMPVSLRSALHLQAAERLAVAGAPAEQVARQLLAAPPALDAWAIAWLVDAAPMLTHRAPRVAVDLLQRAHDGLGWFDPRRETLVVDLAMAHLSVGDNERVEKLTRPVLEYASDPALVGRITWILADALARLGRLNDAIELTGDALDRDGLPPVWLARLRARRAMSLFALGNHQDAWPEAKRAEAEGDRAGDRIAVAYALYTLAYLEFYSRRQTESAKVAVDRALTVLNDEPQASDLLLLLLANLAAALGALGRTAEADAMFARAVVLSEEKGSPPRQAYVRVFAATYGFYRGRWDETLAELETAADLPLELSHREYIGGLAGLIAVYRDDRTAADACLQLAESVVPGDGETQSLIEFLLIARALAAERDGNAREALTRLLAVFDVDSSLAFARLGVLGAIWLPDIVRLARDVGDDRVAEAAATVAEREAARDHRPTAVAVARECRGLVDGDAAAVLDAAEQLDRLGYPLFRAQALENAAGLEAELGNTRSARSAYIKAIEIYTQLDAAWNIIRADTRMRRHNIRRGGGRLRGRPTTGWTALTPMEQKVSRLVASGRSNPDIAAELFLSRHTIESHVSHILTKLKARSRVEVARAVAEQDLNSQLPPSSTLQP